MKKIISLLLVVLLLTACGKEVMTIDSNKAMELIDDGAIVIDVRSSSEFETGHIENAINVPLDEIANINYEKDQVLVLYCATGVRSEEARNTLKQLGYSAVYSLDGGLINWGFELEV